MTLSAVICLLHVFEFRYCYLVFSAMTDDEVFCFCCKICYMTDNFVRLTEPWFFKPADAQHTSSFAGSAAVQAGCVTVVYIR